MPSGERPGFPDQEKTRTKEWPGTRTGKRQRTRTASSSAEQGQNSSDGGLPTAAAAPISHVQLQPKGHKLLFVRCRNSDRQFLVHCGFAVTLWTQTQPHRVALLFNITLTSDNVIPTFGSTTREFNLGGQMFSHNFICAKVKTPILGRDFLAENRLVENYAGWFLTQIFSSLLLTTRHSRPTTSIKSKLTHV